MTVTDLRLTSFAPEHAELVLGWVGTREELEAWSSRSDFPPEPAVFDAWHAAPDVCPFVLLDSREPVAYGEIWEDEAEDEAELARTLVAPHRRDRGIGAEFVRMLAAEALTRGIGEVWLRVVPTNESAIACNRKAGFRRATAEQERECDRGQPRGYVWMNLL